jgi:hypothetical protein
VYAHAVTTSRYYARLLGDMGERDEWLGVR